MVDWAEEQRRYDQDVEEGGGLWGTLEFLSEMPVVGRLLDPAGVGASDVETLPLRQVSEQLSPDVQARLAQSVEAARRLRERPLVSAMKARAASQAGLKGQAAAMAGARPEASAAMQRRGAGLGAQILSQFGPQMAGEAVGRFALGTKMAQPQPN